MSTGRKIVAIGAVALVALLALAYVLLEHMASTDAKVARALGRPIPVQVALVETGSVDEQIGAEGVAKESAIAPLRALVITAIQQVKADVGDVVRKGQTLVLLDSDVQRADYDTAVKLLESARADVRISAEKVAALRGLVEKGYVAEDELRRAMLDHNKYLDDAANAEARLVQTRSNLASTSLESPADAVVTARELSVGAMPKANTEVVTVSVINPIHVMASFAEEKRLFIYPEQRAEVTFAAFPGRSYAGVVRTITPVIDEKTRVLSVVVRMANPGLDVLPGMRGVVRLATKPASAPRVPGVALISRRENTAAIMVIDRSGLARQREVETGAYAEGFVEIRKGLDAGESVVVVGQAGLRDGDKVRIGDEYVKR